MNEPKSTATRLPDQTGGASQNDDDPDGGDRLKDLLEARARVTSDELRRMPPSLTPGEAQPWTRLSRSAFYKMLADGEIHSCRLGHSIRIPTRRFMEQLGVLENDA